MQSEDADEDEQNQPAAERTPFIGGWPPWVHAPTAKN
jgi:hypothetical protein